MQQITGTMASLDSSIFLGHMRHNAIPAAAKNRQGTQEDSITSDWISFFFKLTENNTLTVLVFYNILHLVYASLWGGMLLFQVIENGLMFDFSQAFNPVYFIMQGLVLQSLYSEYRMGNVFYSMVTEVRALTRKLAAFHDGVNVVESMEYYQVSHPRDKEREALIKDAMKRIRDLLMVYTYCTFDLFGIADDMDDYKMYDFADTINMASRKFYQNRLSDENITHILEGAEYYMYMEIAMLHKMGHLSGDMTTSVLKNVKAVSTIVTEIWVSMKPWKSAILDKLPNSYLFLYKYVLVPLGTFSTVGPIWGIMVYFCILFIYNSVGIVVWWLGDPFSQNSRHTPVAFAKIRQQQYANISALLDPEGKEVASHLMNDRRRLYVNPNTS